ncbi:MAG: hypothetical protein OXR62_17170 [Ahrensia sp.]|nr:hypothetical protein [Ahrensia sp.]
MTIYNLLIAEERKNKDTGEVKTFWHRVGSAFPHKQGDGFNLVIPEGLSLSGRVVMFPRDAKEPESAAEAFNEGE